MAIGLRCVGKWWGVTERYKKTRIKSWFDCRNDRARTDDLFNVTEAL